MDRHIYVTSNLTCNLIFLCITCLSLSQHIMLHMLHASVFTIYLKFNRVSPYEQSQTGLYDFQSVSILSILMINLFDNRFSQNIVHFSMDFGIKRENLQLPHHNVAMQKWPSEFKRGFLVTKILYLDFYIFLSTVKIMVVWVWIYYKIY